MSTKLIRMAIMLSLLFCSIFIFAQNSISGHLVKKGEPLSGYSVELDKTKFTTITDFSGSFTINNVEEGAQILIFTSPDGNQSSRLTLEVVGGNNDLGAVVFRPNIQGEERPSDDFIPVVTLDVNDVGDVSNDNVSGLLSASRDVFASTAGFTWGTRRFRTRGYGSDKTAVSLNGIVQNDLERGGAFWGAWGGLNDVTRNQEISLGLAPVDFGYGRIGGVTNISTFASDQRVQSRFSYAATNLSYRHRIMGTYSTGMRPNGWAVTLSGSRRWANEGYVDGTFYDAWSFFASVDRQLGEKNLLNLTILGAPRKTGRQGAAVQEMNDLAGTNYYNPNWGYQNGKKRNARVGNSFQPIAILSHRLEINDHSELTTGVSYQAGRSGTTALDWFNATDPRPDYYRRLPSYSRFEEGQNAIAEALRNNEAERQLDWASFYTANINNIETVSDISNVEGGTLTGKRSNYIIEDRRYDSQRLNFNMIYNNRISDKVKFNGGVNYSYFKGNYFKEVEDLLGGDFYLDVDKYAIRDFPDNTAAGQNDVDNPNRAVKEGDKFGYHYQPHILKDGIWAQTEITLSKFDFNIGVDLNQTQFWRVGKMRNGKFPDNSLGKSERQKFINRGIKAGAVYKIDGRNYLRAQGWYQTLAPYFRNAYISPRTRDQIVSGLKDNKLFSSEMSFIHNSPKYKIKTTGYFTSSKDENLVRSFFHDDERAFVNYSMTGIDKQHFGTELAASAKLTTTLTIHAAAALGQYIYTSRPKVTVSQDNSAELLSENETIYYKNFYVSNGPQKAYNLGLTYRSPKFYSIFLNASYLSDVWISPNPVRRTVGAVEGADEKTVEAIIQQEKTPGRFMLDISGYKSFKWGRHRLAINLSINNLLNITDFVTGGYEQSRFDFEERNVDKFPNRRFYAYGRTFFAGINYSF